MFLEQGDQRVYSMCLVYSICYSEKKKKESVKAFKTTLADNDSSVSVMSH